MRHTVTPLPGNHTRLMLGLLALALGVQIALTGIAAARRGPAFDEPLFAYVGWSWLVKGEAPYRDAFENKTPGIFVLWGLSQKQFGYDPRPLRVAGLVLTVGTAGVVGLVAQQVFGGVAGAWAGGLCLLLLLRGSVQGGVAMTETFMALPGALGWLLGLHSLRRPGVGPAAAAGLLMACAILFKQVMGLEALALLGVLWWLGTAGRGPKVAVYAFALMVPLVLVAGYFGHAGLLREYLDATVGCLSQPGSQPWSVGERMKGLVRFFGWVRADGALLLAAGMWGLIWAWREDSRPEARLALAWGLAGCAGGFSSGWLWEHQFRQVIVALAPLAGWVLARALESPEGKPLRGAATGPGARGLVAVAVGLFLVLTPISEVPGLWDEFRGQPPWRERSAELVEVIKANTSPGDRIYVYPRDESLFILSDRLCAVRYFYNCFLQRPGATVRVQAELERHPPAALVLQYDRMSRAKAYDAFLMDLAARKYRQALAGEGQPLGAAVYQRKDLAAR